MQYILDVNEMRQADATAINDYNIAGELLMENAARSSAEYVDKFLSEKNLSNPLIDIICGSGNNGGDGYALARHLHEKYPIRVFWIGSQEKMTPETRNNFIALEKLNINLEHISNNEDLDSIDFSEDCVIDAMIGVGGSDNIRGIALEILKLLDNNPSFKIAIDAPTGLNTNTGKADKFCFKADLTITMYAIKTGLLLNDGPDVCGDISVAYLGAPDEIGERLAKVHILEDEDIQLIVPERKRISSKFDYGRVLTIAGSKQFPGAAALCSNSTIITGAGLVHLYSTVFHSFVLPEIIPHLMPETAEGSISELALDQILEDSQKADVLAIGPGLTKNLETKSLIKKLINKIPSNISIVIDADALLAIDKNSKLRKNIILTPHVGEFARIIECDRKDVYNNYFELVKEWSKKLNCTIVLKHVPVIITNGEESYFDITGNPGLATGGTGDVLTGIIASLLSQGIKPIEASALGVYLHSRAADIYTDNYSEQTLTSSTLIELIPEVLAINE